MKQFKYNLQFYTDERVFNSESSFILLIYSFFLEKEDIKLLYNDKKTTIHLGEQYPKDINVLEQGKDKHRAIFLYYNFNEYYKLNDSERKIELNRLTKYVLNKLFYILTLDTKIIDKIYDSIIDNNFNFNYNKLKLTNEVFVFSLKFKPELKKWVYYIEFKNINNNTIKNVVFFETIGGNIMFRKFNSINYTNQKDEILVQDYYKEINFIISYHGQSKIIINPKIHSYNQITTNLNINKLYTPYEDILKVVNSDLFYV